MIRKLTLLAAFAALLGLTTASQADEKKAETKKPKVEVVFCLDTTGSMGGLIQGAKDKIWAICNQIVSGKPAPDLKGGLVAVATPFDKRLGEINDELAKSTLTFGSRRKQEADSEKALEATKLAPAAKADRGGFVGKDGKVATYDLLEAIKNKEVDLKK